LRTAGKASDEDNTSATSFGVTLSTDKISFTVAANDLDQDVTMDTSDVDVSNTSVGISYSPSDSLELAASFLTADDNQNDDEYREFVHRLNIQLLLVYKQALNTSQWM
jgi:hypothetical protein